MADFLSTLAKETHMLLHPFQIHLVVHSPQFKSCNSSNKCIILMHNIKWYNNIINIQEGYSNNKMSRIAKFLRQTAWVVDLEALQEKEILIGEERKSTNT